MWFQDSAYRYSYIVPSFSVVRVTYKTVLSHQMNVDHVLTNIEK